MGVTGPSSAAGPSGGDRRWRRSAARHQSSAPFTSDFARPGSVSAGYPGVFSICSSPSPLLSRCVARTRTRSSKSATSSGLGVFLRRRRAAQVAPPRRRLPRFASCALRAFWRCWRSTTVASSVPVARKVSGGSTSICHIWPVASASYPRGRCPYVPIVNVMVERRARLVHYTTCPIRSPTVA